MTTCPTIRSECQRGRWCWVVYLGKRFTGGGPQKRYFDTKRKAQKFCGEQQKALLMLGQKKRDFMLQHGDAMIRAVDRLEAIGATMDEAIDFFAARVAPGKAQKTFAEAGTEYLQKAQARHGDTKYLNNEKSRIKLIGAEFGPCKLNEILSDELEDWLVELEKENKTKKHYLQTLLNVFGFATHRRYCRDNPALLIDLDLSDTPEPPGILTPDQTGQFLRVTYGREPQLLSAVATGFFAGVRRAELFRLQWPHLDQSTPGHVEICKKVAKTEVARYVEILPVLRSWLALCPRGKGRLVPYAHIDSFGQKIAELAAAAGVELPHNGMRHSFASYHRWAFGNEEKTAAQMGNTVGVLRRHYLRPILPAVAEAYFDLTPDRVLAEPAPASQ